MNPEDYYETDDAPLWDLSDQMDEEELAAAPKYSNNFEWVGNASRWDSDSLRESYKPSKVIDLTDPRLSRFNDLGAAFRQENSSTAAHIRDDQIPNAQSEYDVDPMDKGSQELAQYQRWQREDEHDDKLRHYPEYLLDDDELEAKGWLEDQYQPAPQINHYEGGYSETDETGTTAYFNEDASPMLNEDGSHKLEKGPMGPMREPLTQDSGSEIEDFIRLKEEGERISPTERPNAFFMDQRGVHEWYNDGRRNVTSPADWLKRNPKHTNYQDVLRAHQKQQKPGTGVNPAASMKAGSN